MKKIAITDLSYFSDCRRQWHWGRLYQPKRPQSYFWIGSLVHEGLEAYYKNSRKLQPALNAMTRFIKTSYAEMERTFRGTWQDHSMEMEELGTLGMGMVTNYAAFDAEDPLDGNVIAVEKRIEVPLFTGTKLVGKMDLILERQDGTWIVDHKTSASAYDLKGLDVDEQLTGYAYLFYKSQGYLPTGVLYNVLLKDLPSEPRLIQKGLSKDKSQKTVYSLYLAKLQEMGLPTEEYEDILTTLQALGWTKFFVRDGSTRNLHELEAFEARAKRKGEDIIQILRDPENNAYPSPSTFRCSSCLYLGACKAKEDGGDYQYILNNHFLPNTYYS